MKATENATVPGPGSIVAEGEEEEGYPHSRGHAIIVCIETDMYSPLPAVAKSE